MFSPGRSSFTYFHFAASQELTQACLGKLRSAAIAYETIKDRKGSFPLLTPMSEIARQDLDPGRGQVSREPMMGRGICSVACGSCAPGARGDLGRGIVGTNAAKVAAGLGANVIIMDIDLDRLRYLDDVMPANVHTILLRPADRARPGCACDLVVGAGA
jgi:alanine dehydrogenase